MTLAINEALGITLGTAIGDALGAPLEFKDSNDPSNYLTEMTGGGVHSTQPGEWTDDTAMMLGLLDAYNKNDGMLNKYNVMTNWLEWKNYGTFQSRGTLFDIGFTTSEALNKFQKTKIPVQGSENIMSSGNGNIMRIAPVIIANKNNLKKCLEDAVSQSALTHASFYCLKYASILAEELWRGTPLRKYKKFRYSKDISRKKVMSGGFIVETYKCAMWALETSSSFEETLIKAVNRGHDADTSGAVAGMLAGRVYGYESIPKKWLSKLHWADKIYKETLKLYKFKIK